MPGHAHQKDIEILLKILRNTNYMQNINTKIQPSPKICAKYDFEFSECLLKVLHWSIHFAKQPKDQLVKLIISDHSSKFSGHVGLELKICF